MATPASAVVGGEGRAECRDLGALAGHLRPESGELLGDRRVSGVGRGLGGRRVGSSFGVGATSRLARMLARAPMIPMPANITNTAVIRPRVVTG